MGEILFYHLTEHPLERALPALVERSLARGWRVVVQSGEPDRVARLSELLWTFRADSFVANGHAGAEPGRSRPEDQPVWLTHGEDVPNGAPVRFLVDGAEPGDLSGYERAIFMFDGHDEAALAQARAEWKARKGSAELTYWKQNEAGGWEKGG